MTTEERKTPYNSTYPKVAVQWLNQALCFYQSFCLVDSELLNDPVSYRDCEPQLTDSELADRELLQSQKLLEHQLKK